MKTEWTKILWKRNYCLKSLIIKYTVTKNKYINKGIKNNVNIFANIQDLKKKKWNECSLL